MSHTNRLLKKVPQSTASKISLHVNDSLHYKIQQSFFATFCDFGCSSQTSTRAGPVLGVKRAGPGGVD